MMLDDRLAQRVAEAFGRHLQRARRKHGWTQDTFADALGVSRTTAGNIERGQQRVFLDQLYRAALILKVSPEVLLPPLTSVGTELVVHLAPDDAPTEAAVAAFTRDLQDLVRELRGTTPHAAEP